MPSLSYSIGACSKTNLHALVTKFERDPRPKFNSILKGLTRVKPSLSDPIHV